VAGLPPKALPVMTASPKAVIKPLTSLPGRRRTHSDVTATRSSTDCVQGSLSYCIYAHIGDDAVQRCVTVDRQSRESPSPADLRHPFSENAP
jgi:hypothetical protein